MGILNSAFGVKQNPFLDWIGNHRSALAGLGAGIAGGTDFGEGISMGLRGAAAGRQADDAYATQQKVEAERIGQINKTKEYLMSDPLFEDLVPLVDAGQGGAALAEAFKRKQPGYGQSDYDTRAAEGAQYGLAGDDLNTFALTGSIPGTSRANVTYGVNPIYGKDTETGKMGMGVQGSDGSFKLVDTGSFEPLGPYETNAQKAAGTVAGKSTTEAAINLPNTIAQAEQSLANLEGLLPDFDANGNIIAGTNKGFDEQFGSIGPVSQQWLPALDGSEKAGFQERIGQVKGESFLTAITQLKGLGALSDAEGQTATKAISRISQRLPRDEFVLAVRELQDIVAKGVQRAKERAAKSPGADALGVNAGPTTPEGNWVYNPATGKLEQQ